MEGLIALAVLLVIVLIVLVNCNPFSIYMIYIFKNLDARYFSYRNCREIM